MRTTLTTGLAAALLAAAPAGHAADAWGFGSLGVGYEDNVVLLPEEVSTSTDRGDNFLEILGVGGLPLAGSGDTRLSLKGSLYALDYWDLNDYDLATLRAGPELKVRTGAWRWRLEASGTQVYLGHDDFEQLATLEGAVRHYQSRRLSWCIRYEHNWITAYRPYRYLTGSKSEAEVSVRYEANPWRLEGGYELELNDRKDLRQGADFSSYSPTRHTLFGKARVHPGHWRLELKGELRFSVYDDPYRRSGQSKTRRDFRYRLTGRIARDLTERTGLFAEVTRTANDSNLHGNPFPDYSYVTNFYELGAQRRF